MIGGAIAALAAGPEVVAVVAAGGVVFAATLYRVACEVVVGRGARVVVAAAGYTVAVVPAAAVAVAIAVAATVALRAAAMTAGVGVISASRFLPLGQLKVS